MTPDHPVVVAPRRDRVRALGALVAVLSIGMAAQLVYISHVSTVADQRYARQQQTVTRLANAVAAAQRDASAQRRLVRALQRQVRRLGGVPLTEPPPPRSPRGSSDGSMGSGSSAGSSPTPRPSRSPSPRSSPSSSPSPRPSHSPSPTPSPIVCIPGVTCIRSPLPRGVLVAFITAW